MRTRLSWNIILLIAGIALIALTVNISGQLAEGNRAFFVHNNGIVYNAESNRTAESWIENWMAVPFDREVYEMEYEVESWMIAPFESSVVERDLSLESWMNVPFEVEEVIQVESWMYAPFAVNEDIQIENWMTTVWM
jgi:hypothetical protein